LISEFFGTHNLSFEIVTTTINVFKSKIVSLSWQHFRSQYDSKARRRILRFWNRLLHVGVVVQKEFECWIAASDTGLCKLMDFISKTRFPFKTIFAFYCMYILFRIYYYYFFCCCFYNCVTFVRVNLFKTFSCW
jgi:hypothetical protein